MTGFVGSDPQVRQVGTERRIVLGGGQCKNRAGEKQTFWVRVNAEQAVRRGGAVRA